MSGYLRPGLQHTVMHREDVGARLGEQAYPGTRSIYCADRPGIFGPLTYGCSHLPRFAHAETVRYHGNLRTVLPTYHTGYYSAHHMGGRSCGWL